MEEQNMNILERIHASYYQLTATERKVADYVLAHIGQVQFMSITQLADECGTADASISRFCRALKLGRRRRDRIRDLAANHAFDMLRRYLTGLDPEKL